MRAKKWLPPLLILLALTAFAGTYLLTGYTADAAALAALESDAVVAVTQTDYGWRFDGPSQRAALVFYPGARVETAAYAPLMHRLAAGGLDCCLVDVPFHMAFLDMNAARRVMARHDYPHWYVGGHSLGGAIAADFAAGNAVDGVVLCAAYATHPLNEDMIEVLLYGSEDKVLNLKRVEKGRGYAPKRYTEHVIQGGNHARFGSYGAQKGDGVATISPEQQREEAARIILEAIKM